MHLMRNSTRESQARTWATWKNREMDGMAVPETAQGSITGLDMGQPEILKRTEHIGAGKTKKKKGGGKSGAGMGNRGSAAREKNSPPNNVVITVWRCPLEDAEHCSPDVIEVREAEGWIADFCAGLPDRRVAPRLEVGHLTRVVDPLHQVVRIPRVHLWGAYVCSVPTGNARVPKEDLLAPLFPRIT